mmetsp:Transcript_17016/g.38307  ORF Transcript_17016/g.38307 Transcript_17016/m.38307 type:complete len:127 (+) Transcript_17016:2359-2739(+)
MQFRAFSPRVICDSIPFTRFTYLSIGIRETQPGAVVGVGARRTESTGPAHEVARGAIGAAGPRNRAWFAGRYAALNTVVRKAYPIADVWVIASITESGNAIIEIAERAQWANGKMGAFYWSIFPLC